MISTLIRFTGALFTILVAFIIFANLHIVMATKSRVFSLEEVPERPIGLVLGTSNKLVGGGFNPYFTNRISTAAELLEHEKVEHLILSGDNNTVYYNEPATMKEEIMKYGVQDSSLTLDFAGFRTLDSIVRCKEVFGQDDITIVTQSFHAYRALYISDFYKLNAVAVGAEGASASGSIKVLIREIFARPKALLDLYIFKKSPKFLGEKEVI